MKVLWAHIAEGLGFLALGFFLGLAVPHCGEKKIAPMTSIDSQVPKHDVQTKAPIKALDKAELKKRLTVISDKDAKDTDKEVLATGTLKDDSGTTNVGAVLDVKSGETQLVDHRPFAEWMNANEAGVGYGYGTGGVEKAVMYEHTFVRIWDLYGSVEARITDPEKESTRWGVMLWLKYRW